MTRIDQAYLLAQERYAALGADTERALERLKGLSLSLHCWQGDDVGGFERPGAVLSGGGIQVTGNYPGRARTPDELRLDLELAFSLIPGRHRLNLHAMYGEFGSSLHRAEAHSGSAPDRPVDRDEIEPAHFQGWIDWAREEGLGLDFNATCFSHPQADAGYTLSSKDPAVRAFWIEHVQRCREISALFGRELGTPCIHNLWIPDGSKDAPVDRWGHRALLIESLDEIYAHHYSPAEMKDALESKLFGLGSESFVVGSHEFYMGYALCSGLLLCLDLGHFHPTESVADKLSALLQFWPELLLHVSRGVRWDSDHVVVLNDELHALAEEIVRGDALERVHLALDFFDASLNRVGAWVIGARATLQAVLWALLEPTDRLREMEQVGDLFGRLALLEELKTMPCGAVWDEYCRRMEVPVGEMWIERVRAYERAVTARRG